MQSLAALRSKYADCEACGQLAGWWPRTWLRNLALTTCARARPRLSGLVRRLGRRGALVDRDVEAGLLELFLHVDLARLLQSHQLAPHPNDRLAGQPRLANVDRCAGQVRTHDVALSLRCISVGSHQPLLILDRPYRRVHLDGPMKFCGMRARQVGQELGCPRSAVAMILCQIRIHG